MSDAAGFAEHVVRLGEIDLYYTDWNQAGIRTILMIHGFNVQSHTWDPIARELARHARVICPDLRGHGRSSWTESGYGARDFAGDLAALLDHLGIRDCDVVGHSLGTRVALALTDVWSGTVNHLVLSDGGPELARAGALRGAAKGAERLARHGFSSQDEALQFYQEAHPDWQPEFRALHVEYQLKRNWAGKWVDRSDPQLFWVTRGPGLKDNAYLWACAERLTCPCLLAWGETSAYFDADLLATYRRRFGGTFTDKQFATGHYVPREQPDAFCRMVIDYLGLGQNNARSQHMVE